MEQECRLETLVSGNIRFMWIFAGVPRRGSLNDSRVVDNCNFHFSVLSLDMSSASETLDIRPALLYSEILKILTSNSYFTLKSFLCM